MYPYISHLIVILFIFLFHVYCFLVRCWSSVSECIKKQCPFNWMLPLQRPTSGVGSGRDLGLPNLYIFARGHMALCAVSGQFVVPLERHPPSTRARPGPPVPPTWQNNPLKDVPIYLSFNSYLIYLSISRLLLSGSLLEFRF